MHFLVPNGFSSILYCNIHSGCLRARMYWFYKQIIGQRVCGENFSSYCIPTIQDVSCGLEVDGKLSPVGAIQCEYVHFFNIHFGQFLRLSLVGVVQSLKRGLHYYNTRCSNLEGFCLACRMRLILVNIPDVQCDE